MINFFNKREKVSWQKEVRKMTRQVLKDLKISEEDLGICYLTVKGTGNASEVSIYLKRPELLQNTKFCSELRFRLGVVSIHCKFIYTDPLS